MLGVKFKVKDKGTYELAQMGRVHCLLLRK